MPRYFNYPHDKIVLKDYDPLVEEKKILELWSKNNIFEKIKESRREENEGIFVLHKAPPFPTGSPHSGHIYNAIVKDILTRHAHQKNLQVVSEFGLDCHGIAVEHEVNKKLEINRPQDQFHMGVATYNEECRKFVEKNEAEWKNVLQNIGCFDSMGSYSTMNLEYIEGVWSIFKKLYDKGLVYKANKVLPYSTECFTHLSNFEAKQNKKIANIDVAIISLQLVGADVKLLIWTEAPWQLAANFAACVNPNCKYAKVKRLSDGETYIVSRNRVPSVFKNSSDYIIMEEVLGKHLVNLKYQPLFDYIPANFTVLQDEEIREDFGTGIVALCPHFSQIDFRICVDNCLSPDIVSCPIDSTGHFNLSIAELAGLSVVEANSVVVQNLQERGRMFYFKNIKREIGHCPRSDVPLIDKVVSTWFLKVNSPKLKAKMKNNNSHTNWFPESCRKIMKKSLKDLDDWPVGRDRHWGTPIPIWSSPSGDEICCIGSVKMLLKMSGVKSVSDLHKESIDKLLIPSKILGNPPLRRVSEVFDCWFESGVMPFIKKRNQAEVVIEGSDQMKGWFLTTSVLSSALGLPPPSKTIVAHGLIQGSDGRKLSKRRYNKNDPISIAEKYGVDALRLYMTTLPLMSGEDCKVQESEVEQMVERVIQPLYKTFCYLYPLFGQSGWLSYGIIREITYMKNIFDQWILSKAESLIQFCNSELESYRLQYIVPRVAEFLHEVQNWYIPLRKVSGKFNDDIATTMYSVYCKAFFVLAPIAPFVTEYIHQIMHPWCGFYDRIISAHDVLITERSDALVNPDLEFNVKRLQYVIEAVREMRLNHVIPLSYQIKELIVIHPEEAYLTDVHIFTEVLKKILNVDKVTRTKDHSSAKLIAKLKQDFSLDFTTSETNIQKTAEALIQLNDLVRVGTIKIQDQDVSIDDVKLCYVLDSVLDKKIVTMTKDDLFLVIRMKEDVSHYEEVLRMNLAHSIQMLWKKAHIVPTYQISVCYMTTDEIIANALENYSKGLKSTDSKVKSIKSVGANEEEIYQENVEVVGSSVIFYLFKEKETIE